MKLLQHPLSSLNLSISTAIPLRNNIKFKPHSSLGESRVSINCCFNHHQESDETILHFADATPNSQLLNAKVIYSIAPAMGHNKDGHPECNARVPAIMTFLDSMELTPKFRASEIVELRDFKPASVEDVASVHAKAYVSGLERAMGQASDQGIILIEGSGPTYATSTTFQESLLAAGAGISMVDSVVAASRMKLDPPMGFALIRPPGHHAIPKGPMGFCVFGNIAIAARYAQRVHGLKRVFIIDFDVHHGNGTNDAFYNDPDIFFLSTHQECYGDWE